MERKNLNPFFWALIVIVVTVVLIVCVLRSAEHPGFPGLSAKLLELSVAAELYVLDHGKAPQSILDLRDFFPDLQTFERRTSLHDQARDINISIIYKKTGSESYWIGTDWIQYDSEEYRFYVTSDSATSDQIVRRESRRVQSAQ